VLRQRRVVAVKMMSAFDLHDGELVRIELWAQRVALVLAVNAKQGYPGDAVHLRQRGRSRIVVRNPTADVKLEQCVFRHSQNGGQGDTIAGGFGQPVDGKRQNIGALRIADEQHAFFAEVRQVIANHPIRVRG
jgi:hypothetical protein